MRETPERYGEKLHLGWQAYHKYSPIVEHVVAHVDIAKKLCEQNARHLLEWIESDRTNPNGHNWYHGGYSPETKSDWSVSGIYKDVREKIPDAEFISEDLKCGYYVVPAKIGWDVHMQVDLEGHDPYEMWIRGGAQGFYFQSMDNARLWDFYQCTASSKEEAIKFGYYLWARDLVRKTELPAKKNKVMQKIRNLARKLI